MQVLGVWHVTAAQGFGTQTPDVDPALEMQLNPLPQPVLASQMQLPEAASQRVLAGQTLLAQRSVTQRLLVVASQIEPEGQLAHGSGRQRAPVSEIVLVWQMNPAPQGGKGLAAERRQVA